MAISASSCACGSLAPRRLCCGTAAPGGDAGNRTALPRGRRTASGGWREALCSKLFRREAIGQAGEGGGGVGDRL